MSHSFLGLSTTLKSYSADKSRAALQALQLTDHSKGVKMQIEEIIGNVLGLKNGKEYLAISMRQIGGKYLYHLATVNEPFETIVANIKFLDGEFSIEKYTGNDYYEIHKDFLDTVLNDLQIIKTNL